MGTTVTCSATFFVSSASGKEQGAWVERISKRVGESHYSQQNHEHYDKLKAYKHRQGTTADVLSSFKAVTLTGMAQSMAKYLQSLRADELIAASRFRQTVTWAITLGMSNSQTFSYTRLSAQYQYHANDN